RRREEARLEASAATAEAIREGQARELALTAGSRFTLRFPAGVPASALDPAVLAEMLRPYVEFPDFEEPAPAAPTPLRKGMSEDEVSGLYGPPAERRIEPLGELESVRAVYLAGGGRLSVQYVGGVVVAFE